MIFQNREEAGITLAKVLSIQHRENVVVIGLARGGVVVAKAISSRLALPLDVLVIKKIGSPRNGEFAIGALAPDNIAVVNWKMVSRLGIDEQYVRDRKSELGKEIENKMRLYRKGKKTLTVNGKTVILVDDGAATGATMEAAICWCKAKKAKTIIAVAPVAHPTVVSKITPEVSAFVTVARPAELIAVGQFYKEFPQLTDENVIELLT